MKFTIIDSDVYEKMLADIDELTAMVALLHESHNDKKFEKWLTNQDVCQILNISKRTLQTYRGYGKLPFSIIMHTCYYSSEDIEEFLNKLKNQRNGY